MKLDDKFAKWEKTRTKGTIRFIIVAGLYFGILFVILFSFLQFIVSKFLPSRKFEHFFEPEFFIFFIAISLAGGFFWSTIAWYRTEAKYQKHLIGKKSDEFPNQ